MHCKGVRGCQGQQVVGTYFEPNSQCSKYIYLPVDGKLTLFTTIIKNKQVNLGHVARVPNCNGIIFAIKQLQLK